jgi:2-hydroxychromene-2-carboxylate isomerase
MDRPRRGFVIFVGDEMFWGNDRLHFVEAAIDNE